MCSVFGMISGQAARGSHALGQLAFNLNWLFEKSQERGKDGFGVFATDGKDSWLQRETDTKAYTFQIGDMLCHFGNDYEVRPFTMIGNCRAEPTTEWVKSKTEDDQQSYTAGGWTIVHNGTIANDAELRGEAAGLGAERVKTGIDSAAIAEALDAYTIAKPDMAREYAFRQVVKKLKGSFAILAIHRTDPDCIYFANNYRPLWFAEVGHTGWFASSREYLPAKGHMIQPYSVGIAFHQEGVGVRIRTTSLLPIPNRKALVVCSGGLDSTVAAAKLIHDGYDVTLAHFQYGCRAQGPEEKAVYAIAEHFKVPVLTIPMNIYSKGDSPLLRADSAIAGGEQGAEFAHEWVPARNLVMLALATAQCEARGFNVLALGNNLEEAGAYPDNEPEFIKKFNDMLPFAVGAGKQLEVVMPVGNLMKHEIVALGKKVGAPMHLTWSCYRAGEQHCGTCGPCFMRRTAFKINGMEEVISYEKDA